LKGPKPITHVNRLDDVGELLDNFMVNAEGLGDKLSALLWQFPPSFKRESAEDLERLDGFLALLPKAVRQIVEFRHASLFADEVYALLDRRGIGFCIYDSSRWPAREVSTGGFSYVRFHGPEKLYASLYTPAQM